MDYTTLEAQVRLLIADEGTGDDQIFSDAQLRGFLGITRHNVKRAAADALDAIASSEALISKKIKTQDREADGPAVADALRKHASALRKSADDEDAEEDADAFFTAFTITGPDRNEGEEAKR